MLCSIKNFSLLKRSNWCQEQCQEIELKEIWAHHHNPSIGCSNSNGPILSRSALLSSRLDIRGSHQTMLPTNQTTEDINTWIHGQWTTQPEAVQPELSNPITTMTIDLGKEPNSPLLTSPITLDREPRWGHRIRKPPNPFEQYICYSTRSKNLISPTPPPPTASSGTRYPLKHHVTYTRFSSCHQ